MAPVARPIKSTRLWTLANAPASIAAVAAQVTAQGAQKAAGITYQADLDSWTADANAQIKRSAAKTTLIAGLLGAGGQLAGGMAGKYGGPKTTGTTGYGMPNFATAARISSTDEPSSSARPTKTTSRCCCAAARKRACLAA